MNRIVIQLGTTFAPDGSPFVSLSLEEPHVFGSPTIAFTCAADDPAFQALRAAQLDAGSVKRAGEHLFEALRRHPTIGEYLQTALQTRAGSRCPLLVEITAPACAEALPWEALCSPTGDFFGLDERWSLARTVEPQTPGAPFYRFTPPVRIAAVLSCLGISAAGELKALRAAVRAVGPQHVQLLIVASEEQLIVDLQAEIDSGSAPEVARVALIATDLGGLQTLIADFRPHLLHFFCHGSQQGTPHIALALKEDWEKLGPASSGLLVEARDFRGFTQATDDLPWLLVLNCCEGAGVDAGADSQSLALSLALEGIAPAVVGMREAVVSDTANVLTRNLYSKLLSDLVTRIAAVDGSPEPLDWPSLLVGVREALIRTPGVLPSQAAAGTKEWTLPVVYVRPEEFSLQVISPAAPELPTIRGIPTLDIPDEQLPTDAALDKTSARAARLEIEALEELLATLPPEQADGLKAEATRRIAELNARLSVG